MIIIIIIIIIMIIIIIIIVIVAIMCTAMLYYDVISYAMWSCTCMVTEALHDMCLGLMCCHIPSAISALQGTARLGTLVCSCIDLLFLPHCARSAASAPRLATVCYAALFHANICYAVGFLHIDTFNCFVTLCIEWCMHVQRPFNLCPSLADKVSIVGCTSQLRWAAAASLQFQCSLCRA